MATRYVEITLNEMKERLSASKGWAILDEPGGEHVFIFNIPSIPGMQIKVYSSIRKRDDQGRAVGKDAIRVCAILNHGGKIQPVVKVSRVYRTQGWRDNLKARIIQTIEIAKERYGWAMNKVSSQ